MKRFRKVPPDGAFLAVTLALVILGVLMVYDASFARAGHSKATGFDSGFFVKKQMIFALVGLIALWMASRADLMRIRRLSPWLLCGSIMLLPLVFAPHIGVKANGAFRWVRLGPIQFQPSEIAKLCMVLYLASVLAKQQFETRNFRGGLLPHLAILGVICGIVVAQRDLGTTIATSAAAFAMFFAAGALWSHLGFLLAAAAAAVAALIKIEPYRMARILTFIDPWKDYYGSGYQIIHSLIALGSGGILGVGLCEGREKYYLPAGHTDFIFSSIGEEVGLWGTLLIVALFAAFVYLGLSIARRCSSPYCNLLGIGLTSMIGLQAVINIGVATSSVPATGVPLPFISYGGSSLVLTLIAAGLILNVSRHEKAEFKEPIPNENSAYRRGNGRAHLPRSEHRRSGARSSTRIGTDLRGQPARTRSGPRGRA